MKNLMNMDLISQTWVKPNKNSKNYNKVKKMAKRTQRKKMMKKMKNVMKMATESRKLDRKDKQNQQLSTIESLRDKRCINLQSIIKVHTMVKVPVSSFINLLPNLTRSIRIIYGTGSSELAITKFMERLLSSKFKKKLACATMKSINYAHMLTNNQFQALLSTHLT
jgi:hypothetical protein